MFEYESFREEIVRYLCLNHKINRYTSEDMFHDCYEQYQNKIIKNEINNTWTRFHVLNYIKLICKYRYIRQFSKKSQENRYKSMYIEKGEMKDIEYPINSEYNRVDRFSKVREIESNHDTNLIMSIINKELSPRHCKIYKLYLQDYSIQEISNRINTNKTTINSTIWQIKKQIIPKIKELMYG